MADLTQDERQAKKIVAAVDAATKDGVTALRVTLQGDGRIHKGEGPGVCFEEDELFSMAQGSALKIVERGYATPVRPVKLKV